jgi:hypothetical protein
MSEMKIERNPLKMFLMRAKKAISDIGKPLFHRAR